MIEKNDGDRVLLDTKCEHGKKARDDGRPKLLEHGIRRSVLWKSLFGESLRSRRWSGGLRAMKYNLF